MIATIGCEIAFGSVMDIVVMTVTIANCVYFCYYGFSSMAIMNILAIMPMLLRLFCLFAEEKDLDILHV